MPQSFSVSVDLGDLPRIGGMIREVIAPRLSQAVQDVAEKGVEMWQRAAGSAPGVWDEERRAYAASIRYRMTGDFTAEIISDYKYVEDIETGRPAYDMKKMLNTSLKVRVSKKGNRYLIIPFRHNTPGQSAHSRPMPSGIYQQARQLQPSRVTGTGTRVSQTGAWDVKTKAPALVKSRQYAWGERLPAGLAPKLKTTHKTDPYAGMVRFKESTGGSTYMTFRVMSDKSTGWIIPPREGLWIARNVTQALQRVAETEFARAIQMDYGL